MDTVSPGNSGCSWGGKEKSRRFYSEIDARDPHDGKIWSVLLSESKFHQQAGRMWAARTLAYNVPEILICPLAIFVGIREGDELDEQCWLAYAGRPSRRYVHPNDAVPCPDNRVFMVYLDADRVVFSWRWEKVDSDGSGLPIGYASGRYRMRVL